jgi:hypothetical protein
MSTPYFDTDNQDHMDLLPTSMHEDRDIIEIAARAERDIIAFYTRRGSLVDFTSMEHGAPEAWDSDLGLYVYLLGYKTDAAHADVNSNFAIAMRDTIRDVIVWRIDRSKKDVMEAKTVNHRLDIRSNWPPDWNWRLQPYDRLPIAGGF